MPGFLGRRLVFAPARSVPFASSARPSHVPGGAVLVFSAGRIGNPGACRLRLHPERREVQEQGCTALASFAPRSAAEARYDPKLLGGNETP